MTEATDILPPGIEERSCPAGQYFQYRAGTLTCAAPNLESIANGAAREATASCHHVNMAALFATALMALSICILAILNHRNMKRADKLTQALNKALRDRANDLHTAQKGQ